MASLYYTSHWGKEYLWLPNEPKSRCPGGLCLGRSESSSKRHEGELKSKCTPSIALPRSWNPIYLSRPGVGELARTSVRVLPQRAEAGGGAAVGPHHGRVLAAHEEAGRSGRSPASAARPAQLTGCQAFSSSEHSRSSLLYSASGAQSMGGIELQEFMICLVSTNTCQGCHAALLRFIPNLGTGCKFGDPFHFMAGPGDPPCHPRPPKLAQWSGTVRAFSLHC